MARGNAFRDWVHGAQNVSTTAPKPAKPKRPKVVMKGAGGGNRKPKNKNPLAPDSGGSTAEAPHIAPSLPTLDAGLGLNAPGVGAITDSIYGHGFFDPQGTNPYTPVAAAASAGGLLPKNSSASPSGTGTGVQITQTGAITPPASGGDGGFRAWLQGQGINLNNLNPNRRQRLREQYQAAIPAPTAPAPAAAGAAGLNDTNDWENAAGDADPARVIRSMFNEAGLQFGEDAQGRYFESQIPALVAAYDAIRADEANSGMSIMDFVGNLGPVNYGQPNWGQAFNQFWRGRYSVAPQSIRDPYTDATRFEGPSRTLAFGT